MAGIDQQQAPSKGNERYLLCRPIGGLNDTLWQIEQCWMYAEKFGRTLIIDTRNAKIHGDFSDYFHNISSDHNVFFQLDSLHFSIINTTTCYPPVIEKRLDRYKSKYNRNIRKFVESETSIPITFDFEKTYDETVLVHEQCGSGPVSAKLLSRIALNDEIAVEVKSTLERIGNDYIALHVRNTDYITDYKKFFRKIYKKVCNETVLICSDDANVISYAFDYFDKSNVITSTKNMNYERKPLHNRDSHDSDESYRRSTINSIIDLFAIGNANNLFFPNIYHWEKTLPRKIWDWFSLPAPQHYSGFSKLALYLCNNKQLMNSLLRIQPRDQPPYMS